MTTRLHPMTRPGTGPPGQAGTETSGRAGTGPGRGLPRNVLVTLALSVVGLPLLQPPGPGNTALADAGIIAFVVAAVTALRRQQARVHVPYLLGVGLMVLAGAVAATRAQSVVSFLALAQDLFLLVWAAVVANVLRRARGLEVFLKALTWSGTGWAGVMLFGKFAGIDTLAGISERDGGRTAFTLADANMAGSYFLTCLFVLWATRAVTRRWQRVTGSCVLIVAIACTGSNGALTSLALGLAVALLVRLVRERGVLTALSVAAGVLLVAAVTVPMVNVSAVAQNAADSVQLLQDSIGRSDASTSERETLVNEGYRLFVEGDLIGIGPGSTERALAKTAAPYVKEAHDDYVATLVERGVLGGLGLVVLLASVAVRIGRLTWRPLAPADAVLVHRPEMLLALACGFAASASFYEVLHFRHLWAFLGLVAALDLGVRRPWPSR
jgi:O-antigen ligase